MKVGLLNAYHFDRAPNSYRAQYRPMCVEYLKRVLPSAEIQVFEVGQDEWPHSPADCEAWVITGSSKSAYDSDPWISQLIEFVQDCDREKRKLIGICFGHQVVAQALGGEVQKSPRGWGVGVREFKIMCQQSWMNPPLKKASLLFSHQDQVVKLPEGALHLGTDEFCENQMYSLGEHILCLQGHPEFTVEFARSRVEARKDMIGEEKYQEAMKSFGLLTHETEIGHWFYRFLKLRSSTYRGG